MGQSPGNNDDIDEVDEDEVDEVDEVDEKDSGSRKSRVKELSDENARRRNNEKNLQKQLEAVQAKLKEHDDATKSETQRVSDDLAGEKARTAQLLEQNGQLQVENAFLANRKYNWRNPKTALKLLDRSDVSTDKDGVLTGLDEAIVKLAEAEPYLLVDSTDDNSDDEDGDGDDDEESYPTGQKVRRKKSEGISNEELVRKFPALRR